MNFTGVRFNAGETFNVTLDAFEVLALRSVGDLTGTNLVSSEKVSNVNYLIQSSDPIKNLKIGDELYCL